METCFLVLLKLAGVRIIRERHPQRGESNLESWWHEECYYYYLTFRVCQSCMAPIGLIVEASKWSFIALNLFQSISGNAICRSSRPKREMFVRLNATLCTFPKNYVTKKTYIFFYVKALQSLGALNFFLRWFITSGGRLSLVLELPYLLPPYCYLPSARVTLARRLPSTPTFLFFFLFFMDVFVK